MGSGELISQVNFSGLSLINLDCFFQRLLTTKAILYTLATVCFCVWKSYKSYKRLHVVKWEPLTRVVARTHFISTFWSTELARKVSTVVNTRTVILAVTFGFHALPSSAAFTGQTHGSTMGVTCVRIVTVTVVMSPTGKWVASACGVTVVA